MAWHKQLIMSVAASLVAAYIWEQYKAKEQKPGA